MTSKVSAKATMRACYRDLEPAQSARIAAAVPSLVVREHALVELRIERVERTDALAPSCGCVMMSARSRSSSLSLSWTMSKSAALIFPMSW